VLATPEDDAADALAQLADEVSAASFDRQRVEEASRSRTPLPDGPPSSDALATMLARLLPDDAVVVDESISFGRGLFPLTHDAAPHDWLQNLGGAIGHGPPLATGAAIGAPGRRVVNIQADGSAMYTLQALWTQAREKLDVTTIIL